MKTRAIRKPESLRMLLVGQLQDLYSVEQQVIKELPRMEKAAGHTELKMALREHLAESEEHKRRLEAAFRILDEKPRKYKSAAMEGILKEGKAMRKIKGDAALKDAALIAAAQRVEHDEISAYGTARTIAYLLGEDEVAQLMQQTLEEEEAADARLTEIAQEQLYPQTEAATGLDEAVA